MSLIQCIDLGIEFAGKYILKGVNCTIEHNSRIGLIGSNGSGKTTLLKLIIGSLTPSQGTVLRSKKCNIGYLAQNDALDPSITLTDYIHNSRPEIVDLHKSIIKASHDLQNNHSEYTQASLNALIEKMHNIGGYEFENEVKYVLTSLGFREDLWSKQVCCFSGGEQTRICLAALLLTPFDLLILDEPTNHLDIAMIRWLEQYLNTLSKPFLIVSHDRVFLDNTVSSIYAIRHGEIYITKGNYSSYEESYRIEQASIEKLYKRQQKFVATTEAFIQKNIAGQKTALAKSRLKMLQKMDVVDKPQSERRINLHLQEVTRSGNDVFITDNLCFGIDTHNVLATGVSIDAFWKDRIAIIGPNGCGKSTLLKVLLGTHPVLSGIMKTGYSLKIGYYDQHHNDLDESGTVLDTLWNIVPLETKGYVLSWLARFGFRDDDIEKPVSSLSGGEKSRLFLSVLIHKKPNLLIMDEPTNHLDIPMNSALLEALQSYKGTIIFVSHDRYFISQLANKFWVFTKQLDEGKILKTIIQPDTTVDIAIDLAFSVPEPPPKVIVQRERKKKVNPWQVDQLHKQIENKRLAIEAIQEHLSSLHRELTSPNAYESANRVRDIHAQCKELEAKKTCYSDELNIMEDQYLEMICDE